MLELMAQSSWQNADVDYQKRDLDLLVARDAPDAISMPANHRALRGHDEIRAWYARRTGGDHEMNIVTRPDSVDMSARRRSSTALPIDQCSERYTIVGILADPGHRARGCSTRASMVPWSTVRLPSGSMRRATRNSVPIQPWRM